MSIIERALKKSIDAHDDHPVAREADSLTPPGAAPDAETLTPPGVATVVDVEPRPTTEPLIDLGEDDGPTLDADALAELGAADSPVLAPASDGKDIAPGGSDPEARRANSERIELDWARLASATIITPEMPHALLAEQFRMLKRPLLIKAAAEQMQNAANANLILVTSSVPGEGKTFTSTNLAMSIAMELDRTVLLVDADVHRSDVSALLGIDERPGLTEHLLDEQPDLSSLLLRTNMETLSVLPSGRHVGNATELFAGQEMLRLTRELSSRYEDRIVIIDSPPLLATTEASVLAQLVGQVLMVVEAVRTPQSALNEAIARLHGVENVSLVLNKSRQRAAPGYGGRYGYGQHGYRGYGYGYGRGGGPGRIRGDREANGQPDPDV